MSGEVLRKQAISLFLRVSRQYPAKAAVQAAAISLACGERPDLLSAFQALHTDAEALHQIADTATRAHRKSRNARAGEDIRPEDVAEILTLEAGLTGEYRKFPRQRLQEIINTSGPMFAGRPSRRR